MSMVQNYLPSSACPCSAQHGPSPIPLTAAVPLQVPAEVGRFVLLGHTDGRGAPVTMLTTVSCGLDAQNQPMGSTCNIAWKSPPVTTEHVWTGTSSGGVLGISAQVTDGTLPYMLL